jgi:type IV pilus assembly protein PilV
MTKTQPHQHGFSMIEVLVTIVILLVGLLGLASLIMQSQRGEMESYQRVQALVMVRDMADRINANRGAAANYVAGAPVSAPLGVGSGVDCTGPATTVEVDLCQWDSALKGAAESSGGACNISTGANCVGSMIGARGCITNPVANQYLIQVVWQGLGGSAAPPASVLCGKDSYGDETLRRAVTTVVQIGTLSP